MFELIGETVLMEVTDQEAMVLGQIPALLDSVGVEGDDRAYAVLHRPLYPDDPDADIELQAVVTLELDSQRASDRPVLERSARTRSTMTRDEAHGLLRSLNEARLVLAARAGAFDEGPSWEDRIDQDPALAAVAWLGYVQGELIGVLAVLPDG